MTTTLVSNAGELFISGYVSASNSIRTNEINPLDQKYLSSTLVDITDIADGTYHYYVDMAGFRKSAYQLILDGGSGTITVTFGMTVQDDGTAPGSCTYVDVTNDLAGVANFTASELVIDDSEVLAGAKYVHIQAIAATAAADDADITIFVKRYW